MTGDRTETDPEPGTTKPVGGARTGPPATGKAERDDVIGAPSMAELSRRLAERAARQQAVDPGAAAAERRAALEAYDLARERRLIAALSVILALTVSAAVAYFVSTIDSGPVAQQPSAAAHPAPAPPQDMASAAPAAVPVEPPSPSTTVADTAVVAPAAPQAPPATVGRPAPVEATPNESPLQRDDVREIQAKLRSFGFNPGPVDGTAGRMTEVAVRRYQQARDKPQTGEIDRQLLEQLRQDPAPPATQKVAQRGARPDGRATGAPRPRHADPFEPVRAAGDRVGRWLDSLIR